jgi:pyrroline-5-carboxylate reductase
MPQKKRPTKKKAAKKKPGALKRAAAPGGRSGRKRPTASAPPARKAGVSYDIGFVGGGNMANALIGGLIQAGLCKPGRICASDIDAKKRNELKRRLGIAATADNLELVSRSKVLFLAVKPQIVGTVLAQMRPAVTANHLFISIVAGVSTRRLEEGLGGARVIRVMPNTPALLGKAMSVLVRGRKATAADERLALKLLASVGKVRAVRDEALLDPVTGLSGSGPAYVYCFAEALIAGGVAAGLPADLATELALQTITGAAAMMQETGEPPEQLRAAVSSPGGTTLAGLEEMGRRSFKTTVAAAVLRATERSIELGKS